MARPIHSAVSAAIAYTNRILTIYRMVPGVLFIFAMCFQPETPRWLVEHGDFDRAGRALAYVSSKSVDDESVHVTLDEIKADFEGKDRLNMWQQLKGMAESRPIMLRSLIPSLVLFFQQWTGTNTINYFSPEIFEGLGITGETSGLFATGECCAKTVRRQISTMVQACTVWSRPSPSSL